MSNCRRPAFEDLRRGWRPLIEQLPLPGPLAVHIESTNRCNLACPFCPQSSPGFHEIVNGAQNLPMPLFIAAMSDLARAGLKAVRLWGIGEPLLLDDIFERTAAASRLNVRTDLLTNGLLLSVNACKKMESSGLDYLRLSDYGARTPDSAYEVLAEFISRRIARPRIEVKCFTPERLAEVRARHPHAADDWIVLGMHNWASTKSGGKEDPRMVCPSPFHQLYIRADGTVFPCCGDWKQNPVGTIHEQGIIEIWKGEKLEAFRRMHIEGRRFENPACGRCTMMPQFRDNLDGLACR